MRKSLYLLVLVSMLVAGCTQGATTTQNSELLRISGVTVTPGTVVAPDEIITIRMKLDNIGQEDVKFVWKNPCYKINELSATEKTPPDANAGTSERKTACLNAGCAYNLEAKSCYSWQPLCYDEYCPIKDVKGTDNSNSLLPTPTPTTELPKTTPLKKATDLSAILYDYCGNLYGPPGFATITSGFETENGQLTLKPSRSALLEWTLKAPSETTIANMQQECTFRFQINYQAKAETFTYIYFANPDEKNQRTYTNKDMNLRGENVANFGPVYINFETAQDQPIKGNSNSGTEKNTWTLYTTIRNAGDGIGKIMKDSFKIELPGFITKDPECGDFNIYAGGEGTNNPKTITRVPAATTPPTDDSRLKLYSKQSSRFSCTLPAPKVDVLEPYRFISSADYVYTIDKELKITTVPKRT